VLERKVNCSLPQRGRARVGAIISAGKGVFVQAIDKQGAKCLHALNRVRYYAWKKIKFENHRANCRDKAAIAERWG